MFSIIKRYKAFVFLCLVVPLFACQCTLADLYNQLDLDSPVLSGELTDEQHFCVDALQLNGMSQYDALRVCTNVTNACLQEKTTADMTADEMLALCGQETITPNQPISNIAPPKPMSAPMPDCSMFRLTSPTDGLPNGMATFYWDPLPDATGYMIDVLGEGAAPVKFMTDAPKTNLQGDVSMNAIGGLYAFTVQVSALIGEDVVCTHSINIMREAPNFGGGNQNDHDGEGGGGGDNGGESGGGGVIVIPMPPPDVEIH